MVDDDADEVADAWEVAQQLEIQIRINEVQLRQLQDALSAERFKLISTVAGTSVTLLVLVGIVLLLTFGANSILMERYSAIINIGAVFALFGLYEAFGTLSKSFSLIKQFRRLIFAQIEALEVARSVHELHRA